MKKNKVIALLNDDGTKMISMVIDGKKHKMNKNETYPEFYQRLMNKVGYDFLEGTNIETKKIKTYKKVKGIKVASLAIATVMGLTSIPFAITGCSQKSDKDQGSGNPAEQIDDSLISGETNSKLKAIYEKLLNYNDGERIVKELQRIDKLQGEINEIAIANPDGKGKVSYVLAEELAAIHDVYNARTNDKTILESKEIGTCYYYTGEANLINLSQGSRDVQEIEKLITDETIQDNQEELQTETQKALDNNNIASKTFMELLQRIYGNRNSNPESQMEMAWGQPSVTAALSKDGLTGEELQNYQEVSKNDGTQANRLFTEAYSDDKRYAEKNDEISIKKQRLINNALEIINIKNHTNEYDNTGYDPSTTEKGKQAIVAIIGNLGIDSQGGYWVTNKTTHTRTKISKEEAIKKYGKDKVKEAEKKAEANTKVDTDGDGKKDTIIPEANKNEEEKAEQMIKDYTSGKRAGITAFASGGSSTTMSGSSDYKRGYRDGYAQAKSVYDKQMKDSDEKNNKPTTEPTIQQQTQPSNNNTEVKSVEKVEDKSNSMEIILKDGTSYETTLTRVRA